MNALLKLKIERNIAKFLGLKPIDLVIDESKVLPSMPGTMNIMFKVSGKWIDADCSGYVAYSDRSISKAA